MKRRISYLGEIEKCEDCGHDVFRLSTRSKYINKEKTAGTTYELQICDKCGKVRKFNERNWHVKKIQ